MSASTRTSSCRSMTPARRSKTGGSITIISGRTPRSAMSRRPSSPPNSLPHPKPNFPVLRGPNAGRRSLNRRPLILAGIKWGGSTVSTHCPFRNSSNNYKLPIIILFLYNSENINSTPSMMLSTSFLMDIPFSSIKFNANVYCPATLSPSNLIIKNPRNSDEIKLMETMKSSVVKVSMEGRPNCLAYLFAHSRSLFISCPLKLLKYHRHFSIRH